MQQIALEEWIGGGLRNYPNFPDYDLTLNLFGIATTDKVTLEGTPGNHIQSILYTMIICSS